jgi:hypothetical protein
MREIDYSDRAISMRITRMAQLRNLCVSLARAGKTDRKPHEHAPLKPSTSTAESGPRSGGTHRDSD